VNIIFRVRAIPFKISIKVIVLIICFTVTLHSLLD
jgi:hypothetical protein